MKCWHCKTELIWGGDHDIEENEDYDIITNLSCPNCHSYVEVYHPSEKLRKEEDIERETPEESYHRKLGEMIKKVKAETKWRDIFKIVEEAQKRLNEKEI